MSLLKLSLLLCSTISFDLALAERPSSLNEEDKVMVTSLGERIWRQIGVPTKLFLQGMIWLSTIGESIVIINSLWGTLRLPDILLHALGPAESSQLSFPFVLGATLVIIGGIVRVAGLRALGPYYTFVQVIRREHKLITTGPFAVVRHPAYAGLLSCIVGWGIVHGCPRSWIRISGVLDFVWTRVLFTCYSILMVACFVTVFRRSVDEDQFLSQRFGAEWESWARRVRYRLIPFIW